LEIVLLRFLFLFSSIFFSDQLHKKKPSVSREIREIASGERTLPSRRGEKKDEKKEEEDEERFMTSAEVGESLDEMASLGRQIISCFRIFFPDVNLTP